MFKKIALLVLVLFCAGMASAQGPSLLGQEPSDVHRALHHLGPTGVPGQVPYSGPLRSGE